MRASFFAFAALKEVSNVLVSLLLFLCSFASSYYLPACLQRRVFRSRARNRVRVRLGCINLCRF